MKKRVISLLLVLTLCLGLLPAPVFAEEAPTNQTLAETPVSQNEEPKEPQEEPAPQSQEPQQPQQEPAPQGQENQQPQPEPAPQDEETPQPQPEPAPQDEETPQPPQEEPEQEEQPVRRVLKANAPMAVAEVGTTLTVGQQEGKLFAGVGGNATFWVGCDNADLNSLTAVFEGEHSGLSVAKSEDGASVTVTADKQVKKGAYTLTLALGQTSQTVSVIVDVPFTIGKEIQVASDQTSATLTVNVTPAQEIANQITYVWMEQTSQKILRTTSTNEVKLTPADLTKNPKTPSLYSDWISCRVTCGEYSEVASGHVTINTCDHTKEPITYDHNGNCKQCGESCGADKPFITENGSAIEINSSTNERFFLDSYFPGTLYLWTNYTTRRELGVLELHGDGTLNLQGHNVGSELILDYFQNLSFTIQNGSLHELILGEAGSLILDDVTIENPLTVPAGMDLKLNNITFNGYVRFNGPASLTGGTFDAGLSYQDEQGQYHPCLELLAPGYAFKDSNGKIIDASGESIQDFAQVVSHTCTYEADKAGKCDCGRSCPHKSLNEGYCTVCQMLVEPFAIGEQGYRSLEEALEAAQEGQTIYLRGNYKLPNPVEISKNITLDLNSGCVLSGSFESSLLQITGANVTVQSGGIVNDQGPAVTVASGAKLTVKTVTFAGGSDHVLDVEHGGHVDVQSGSFYGGVLYVNGSLSMKEGSNVKLELGPNAEDISIVKGDFDSITLAGGKKYKDLLATGSAYWANGEPITPEQVQANTPAHISTCTHPDGLTDSQPCPYCDKTCGHKNIVQATGFCNVCGYQVYKAKVNEDMKSTFQEAMKDVQNGQTVTLLADGSLDGNLTLNKAITLNINEYTLKTGPFTVEAPLTICGGGEIKGEFSFHASVTVQGTTLEAPKGVVENGGSLCIEQGATVTLVSVFPGGSLELKQGTIGKLYVDGGTVRLSSGTVTQNLEVQNGKLLSILDKGKALKKDGNIVKGNDSKVDGPVTVVDHTHTFNEENTCPCGLSCNHLNVTDGTCDSCGTAFAAKVDEGTYYQDVGKALKNAGQIVCLLRDAVLGSDVTVQENITLRVDAFRLSGSGEILIPGDVTFDSDSRGRIDVPLRLTNNGTLILKNAFRGTISSLTVEGAAKLESDGVFKGRVEKLSISENGGAELFSGSFGAIRCSDGQFTAKELLPDGYAFYKTDTETDTNAAVPCSTLISQDVPLENVAVDVCGHTAIDDHGNCAYCGMHFVAECVVSGTKSYYKDLQSALDHNQSGTVKLLDNIESGGPYEAGRNGTLDLNGKTLNGAFVPKKNFTIQDNSQTPGKIESLVAGAGTKISGGNFGTIKVTGSAPLQSILADSCYYEQNRKPYDIPKDATALSDVRVARCNHTSVRENKRTYTCNCGQVTYLLTVTVGTGEPQYFGDYNDGFDYAAKNNGVVRFLEIVRDKPITVDVHGTVTIDMEEISYSSSHHNWKLVIKSGSTVQLVGQGVVMSKPETGGGSGIPSYGEFIPVTVEAGGTFVLPANHLNRGANMAMPSRLTVQSGGTAELQGGSTGWTYVYGTLNISGGNPMYIVQYDQGQLNITDGQINQLQIYGDLPRNTLSGGSYEKISVWESNDLKKFRDVTFDDFQNMLASGKAFQSKDDSSYLHEVEKDPNYGTSGTYSKELNKVNVTAAPFTGVQVVCQIGEDVHPGSFTTVYGELEQDFCLKAQLESQTAESETVTYQWYQLQGENKTPLGPGAEYPLQKDLALGQYTYQVTASCKGFERTSEAFTVTVAKASQTLAVEAQLKALPATAQPWEQTLEDTKIIPARSAYDRLTEAEKAMVELELLQKLETLEAGLKQWSVTQGNGQTWARGSREGLRFTLGGQTRKLNGLAINGKLLEKENYEVQDTLDAPFPLTLSAEYLQALEPGTYTLEVRFDAEPALKATFTVEIPDTYLDVTGVDLAGNTTVTVNGVAYPVEERNGESYVNLPETGDLLTAHNYQTGSESPTQDNYPTQMQVYRIIREETGARLERIYELDNLLQYAGCSIRLNGTKGIRMITSVDEKVKNALVNATLAGFTLEEYGTVVMRGVGTPTLETGSHNYAYKRGVNDPVFAKVNGRCQYTNVLVGFTMEDCKQTLTLRPYIILKDQAGVLYTLYGGCVSRSIGYIAKQNENTYKPGTEGYRYVHEIIDAVYGQG